jgi:hypothetical protein
MKIAIFSVLFFLLGIGLGVTLMLGVIKNGPDKVIADESHGILEMNVVYATLLHDKKEVDLARLLERQMTASLTFQDKLGFDDEGHSSARLVRGYYDLAGTQPPAEVASYISGVKGNDVRRLADAVADSTR